MYLGKILLYFSLIINVGDVYMKRNFLTITLSILLMLILSGLSHAEEDQVHLIISKSKHTLTIVLNNHPVYTFPIATGATPEKTPEGTFTIIRKVKNPWYLPKNIPGGDPNNPLGSRWIGLNVPNTNGYKYGIHGTNNPDSIGQSISQGCIRMKNTDVEWIFRHIPLKTKVMILP